MRTSFPMVDLNWYDNGLLWIWVSRELYKLIFLSNQAPEDNESIVLTTFNSIHYNMQTKGNELARRPCTTIHCPQAFLFAPYRGSIK